ncbi:MAG: Ada metal-binding domain-containing protein [Dermatophilaceae bacterium]
MHDDTEACERAIRSRDARFDGWFICAVVTTGIYCRPSCPARPHLKNLRFYPSAAAAQQAGFRACKRCRPRIAGVERALGPDRAGHAADRRRRGRSRGRDRFGHPARLQRSSDPT